METSDVVIVGGGVIGLSIAYGLARVGFRPTLIDRGRLGRESSWAGAGILSPGSTNEIQLPMARLRTISAHLFNEWSPALRDLTGIDNGYRVCGGIDVAFDEQDEHELNAAAGRWKVEGIQFEKLSTKELLKIEPCANPSIRSAWYIPDRAQIRNPWHLKALMAACTRLGVRIYPGRAALGFQLRSGKITAVKTSGDPIYGHKFVLAAGAWTGSLLESVGLSIPTPPIRGQIVLLKTEPARLRRILEHGRNYLVPREDGRVLVGATEERVGFVSRATVAGTHRLIELARLLCPFLGEAEFETTWAGLRPGSKDTRPYIGQIPDFSNLILATGHGRAGIQLSPGTAMVVHDLILDVTPRIKIEDFSPVRDAPTISGDDTAFRS